MLSSVTSEINEFKSSVEKQNKIFAAELRDVSHDSAERDNQLSKFVEVETKKILETANTKYDKLKFLLTKVAEQFKAHLKKFEKVTSDVRAELNDVTLKVNEAFGDISKNIGYIEGKVEASVKEATTKLEKENDVKFKLLQDRVNKLNEKEISDFGVLKGAIEGQAEIFNSRVDKLAELSEQYHKSNFLNLKLLVDELDRVKACLGALDSELEEKWQEMADRADMIDLINSEGVKRADFDEYLETKMVDLTEKMQKTISQIEGRFENTDQNMNEENEDLKKKLGKLQELAKGLSEKIETDKAEAKKQLDKLEADITSTNCYTKAVEIMARAVSQRTYSDLGEINETVELISKMVNEEKKNQVKESETLRKILFDLNKTVDVELPERINSSVMKVLESVKEESIKIWEVCLDYAQKVEPNGKAGILKQNERLNNYTYAVGGKDSYGIPALGDAGVDDLDASGEKSGKSAKVKDKGKKESSEDDENEDNEEEEEEEEEEEDEEEEEEKSDSNKKKGSKGSKSKGKGKK